MKVIILFSLMFLTLSMPDKNKTWSIVTANQNKDPLFSFGLIADPQYCDCNPVGTRFYRSSLLKLKEAVVDFTKDSVDFIINLGDLIEKNAESFTPLLDILESSGLKTYHCSGNHDYSVDKDFKDQIPVLKDHKNGYYYEDIHGFELIFLNGNEVSTYSSDNEEAILKAGEYLKQMEKNKSINAFEWNGGIGKVQLLWLDQRLTDARAKNREVIIFCHFPVAPENIHNLLNYNEVLTIIGKYQNIAAWISGHNHAGNYALIDGVHFLTMKGMVETESTNNHAIGNVFNDRIEIKGFGDEKDRILYFNR